MFNVGDSVNYHSYIGGTVTSGPHEVIAIELQPNNYGTDVAWITGKAGCVALAALSNKANPMQDPPKTMTKSQRRYEAYLSSESNETFGEWLTNHYWDDYRVRHGV